MHLIGSWCFTQTPSPDLNSEPTLCNIAPHRPVYLIAGPKQTFSMRVKSAEVNQHLRHGSVVSGDSELSGQFKRSLGAHGPQMK